MFVLFSKLRNRARSLKREATALYIAVPDPRVPWYAKVFLALVLANTFSPVDLIPDFIPILGWLDDMLITPLGIALALRMIPPEVIDQARIKAERLPQGGGLISLVGAMMVGAVWMIVIIAILWAAVPLVRVRLAHQ